MKILEFALGRPSKQHGITASLGDKLCLDRIMTGAKATFDQHLSTLAERKPLALRGSEKVCVVTWDLGLLLHHLRIPWLVHSLVLTPFAYAPLPAPVGTCIISCNVRHNDWHIRQIVSREREIERLEICPIHSLLSVFVTKFSIFKTPRSLSCKFLCVWEKISSENLKTFNKLIKPTRLS